MTGTSAAWLILLILSPWIIPAAWVACGMVRDYVWFNYGIDLLRRRS
jgi:hypothetical protein